MRQDGPQETKQVVDGGTSSVSALSYDFLQCYGAIELSSSGLSNPTPSPFYFNPSRPSDPLLCMDFNTVHSSSILLIYLISDPFLRYDILCMCGFSDSAP